MNKKFATVGISFYQIFLSPVIKVFVGYDRSCRFEETCSQYTKRAVIEKGLVKGLVLGIIRISKCQPYYKGDLRKGAI